jgi:hypothetical protein
VSLALDGGATLYLVRLSPGRPWQSVQRAIQRRGGEFARVLTKAGDVVVVTTAAVDGVAAVSPGLAVEALAEALEDVLLRIGPGHKPISASKGWRLHERRGGGRYRRRGMARRGGFPVVIQQAASYGMRTRVEHTDSGKIGGWRFPGDWTEEQRDAFFAEVAVSPILRRAPPRDAATQAV